MNKGICKLSIIPIRKEPSHRSEQVSQLLFGESYIILNSSNSNWLYIQCAWDNYEGWIDTAQHTALADIDNSTTSIALETLCVASSSSSSISILAGSDLPNFDGLNFKIGKEKFVYNGQALMPDTIKNTNLLDKIAMRYLHAPYLWGGRSPLGIDCSGFTQVVFKFLAIALQRDAYQQAEQGLTLNFLEEAKSGDLAFFNNNEGKITHVGIILNDNRIIHASGKVRIDTIDHFGIFNADIKKYSHQLKIIKRIL